MSVFVTMGQAQQQGQLDDLNALEPANIREIRDVESRQIRDPRVYVFQEQPNKTIDHAYRAFSSRGRKKPAPSPSPENGHRPNK
jgi:hypothetical protein